MLEFQEGFFEQEVRDGFYVDSTMKTVWAAELEVLQKIAEICERHGIKWYAAYGTLLGAIRHEGFIPWDDDMDIWVKRPDYNRLMKLLPKELPEGYRVRSPLTEEGYEQFHTCINSGSGISIAKEWLEQFHGCPFTVGLDIFPLDYLPRDERERELQTRLFTMTGRIAQLAKNIGRGEYDSEEDDEKQNCIEEVRLGIDYLEENCKLHIDHNLLEEEKWGELCSELWKWGNYLAMMYSEEESDYLVEYLDYIQCTHKIYPKEWFEDGYSAKYENFMLPIPAGYHEVLCYIYGGDYSVRIKRTGMHEYPYYDRQLRQLREYVKNVEQRAQDVGLISIDEIEVQESSKEIPAEWISRTVKEDGSRKPFVLSANDPVIYAIHGDKALDKLEEMFRVFEQVKDSVLLWWRPQPVMRAVLEQVSSRLSERYQEILEHYKEAGWGICDETDNIDRAVEVCDIYYGDMNAVLQPFQEANKPIMLAVIEDENETAAENSANKNNRDRSNECRVFVSLTDYVEDGDIIYFANANYNALIGVNKKTRMMVKHVPFVETPADIRNIHLQCVRLQNQICFLPAGEACLHLYNIENGVQKKCHFLEEKDAPKESWGYFSYNESRLYLLPCRAKQGLWSYNAQADVAVPENWWEIPAGEAALKHGEMDSDRFYTLEVGSSQLYITNVADKTVESVFLPDENVLHITYDGQNFWYTSQGISDIVCWNQTQGVVDRYLIPYDINYWYGIVTYQGMHFAGGNLFLVAGGNLCVLDRDKRELRELTLIGEEYEDDRSAFFEKELTPYFKYNGDFLLCMLQNAGKVFAIDLNTLEVKQMSVMFQIDEPIKEAVSEYICHVLLDRRALLLEEAEVANMEFLLRYCKAEGGSICS